MPQATPSVKPAPMDADLIVTLQINNQTSVAFSTGSVNLSWGNQISFNNAPAFIVTNPAFVGQGSHGSATGTTGTASWSSASSGGFTVTFDDPWGSYSNSISVSGDSTFNSNFNISCSTPSNAGALNSTITITPKS